MKYTPESIVRVLSGVIDVSACLYMTQCESGMSSAIGKIWQLANGKWIALEQLDWPMDMTKEPYNKRIRWGSTGNGVIQMNVHQAKIHAIYKYDGETLTEVMVKTLP